MATQTQNNHPALQEARDAFFLAMDGRDSRVVGLFHNAVSAMSQARLDGVPAAQISCMVAPGRVDAGRLPVWLAVADSLRTLALSQAAEKAKVETL